MFIFDALVNGNVSKKKKWTVDTLVNGAFFVMWFQSDKMPKKHENDKERRASICFPRENMVFITLN